MTYTIPYHCTNCDHGFDKMFDYGVPAPAVVVCPNCGCYTGEKQRGHRCVRWVSTYSRTDDFEPEFTSEIPEYDTQCWPYRGEGGCYS